MRRHPRRATSRRPASGVAIAAIILPSGENDADWTAPSIAGAGYGSPPPASMSQI
jgi:hypothetical protein